MIADLAAVGLFSEIQDILQTAVHVTIIIADHHDTDGRGLPLVFRVQLRDRDIIFRPDLVLQTSNDHTLVLERLGRRDIEIDRQNADVLGVVLHRNVLMASSSQSPNLPEILDEF